MLTYSSLFHSRLVLFFSACVSLASLFTNPSQACSPTFAPQPQEIPAGLAVPANAIFSFWHFDDKTVSAQLLDSKGNRVAAELITHRNPEPIFLDERYYSVLKPIEPLPAGTYRFSMGGSRSGNWREPLTVTVANTVDNTPSAAPQKLSAQLETVVVPVGVNADCSRVLAGRPFLALRFDETLAPGEKSNSLIYELTATAPIDAAPMQRILSGQRLRRDNSSFFKDVPVLDGRTLLVPLWWLKGFPTGRPIGFALRAIDRAGNKSEPAKFVWQANNQRETDLWETLKTKENQELATAFEAPLPADALQSQDLGRLKSASVEPLLFDSLAPLQPAPIGERYDTNFARDILARNQEITIEATLKGAEHKSHLWIPAEVRDSKLYPIISAQNLQNFIAILPLDNAVVKYLSIWFYSNQRASASLTLADGTSQNYMWSPDKPVDIGAKLKQIDSWRRATMELPLYKALAAKYGAPRDPEISEMNENRISGRVIMRFGAGYSSEPRLSCLFRGDTMIRCSFRGSLSDWSIDILKQPLEAISQQLHLTATQQAKETVYGEFDIPSQKFALRIQVSQPEETNNWLFGGKIGQSQVKQDPFDSIEWLDQYP